MLLAVFAAPARAVESPATDPFYAAPPDLARQRPGAVLRTREVEVTLGSVTRTAQQLLYRTADAHGRPVVTATTVLVGDGEAPADGRDLVSLQDAEDSLDPTCAPSYQLQIGARDSANLQAESSIILTLLATGATVVVPDHEGPESQYIVKDMEGRATLDGIRAAERFAPSQLAGRDTQVALVGYSGGAHASAAANELHPAYAPELDIVAVAAGGVPVGNRDTFSYIDGGVGTGVLLGVSIAIDRAFPSFGFQSLLNERGKALAKEFETGCASSVFGAPFTRFDDYTVEPGAVARPDVAAIIRRNALGHTTPIAPTFYYNAISDELIWIKPLDELVAQYCGAGAAVSYFRDPAGLEHIQAVANFVPMAEAYIIDRFAGRPVANTCPQPQPPPHCVKTLRLRVPAGTRKAVVVVDDSVIKTVRRKRIRVVRLQLAGRTPRVILRMLGRRKGRMFRRTRKRTVRLCPAA